MIISLTTQARLLKACESLCRKNKKLSTDVKTRCVNPSNILPVANELKSSLINISIYGDGDDETLDGIFIIGGDNDYLYPIFIVRNRANGVLLKVWVDSDGKGNFVALNGGYKAVMSLATPGEVCEWISNFLRGLS